MKPVLIVLGAALALSSAPVMAQEGQRFDFAAQDQAYSNDRPGDKAMRCFDGRFITGANRSGDKTLYVQTNVGGIYRLRMTKDCDGLNDAQKISVRAHDGSDLICSGDSAEMVARTAAGARHCPIADVRRLNPGGVSALATATKR
ncbi:MULTISPECIES: DUF6491 family protein [unclassified Caulobacter]|uniref:DUF6491 family protein n=1 Tax=unclassified Caulobacter TaxID=2648921 RepID=UPI0006F37784|nr:MULTISPECIES: DUF6491 family protein [unclassified Caulobacter]KQV58890.1 hypothetical protein ASC62_09005 [Caulobacter sp. Root342]KQV68600.1 hypothetical protein ASC70_07030 [Caulobacter sp. Root343]